MVISRNVKYFGNLSPSIILLNTLLGKDKMAATLADNIFKCNFVNENVLIPIKISLQFISKGLINNIPSLVQIMAWCRPGDISHYLNQWWLDHWCIYASLGLNELGLISWCPIFKVSNSFEDQVPVAFIYRCLTIKYQWLDYMTGYQDSSSSNGCQVTYHVSKFTCFCLKQAGQFFMNALSFGLFSTCSQV